MSESLRHVVREIYCEVLFELAEETDLIDRVADDLVKVRTVLEKEPEFAAIMDSPTIRGPEKSESIRRVFRGHISDLALDFLSVLARRGRMGFLSGIADRYENLVDRHHHRQPIEVVVSKELNPEQIEKLKTELTNAVKGQIKLSVNVDEGIIGGIIIKKDDTIVDNSVRTALKRASRAVAQSARARQQNPDKK
ncbi:MAG: ATP synthase F1 subunit delta [Sedimentisphaerales bacterium]|nr:ATP synthase F1 subunit delta [Sedimentisphaerales bacterium]